MEFTIRVSELAKALSRVQGIVEKKTTMPILANVLIKSVGKDRIQVAATDLEIAITAEYDAEVMKPGAITLRARELFDIVRSLPAETVQLVEGKNHWVEIKAGKTAYKVVGLKAEAFPALPSFEDVDFFEVAGSVFHEMIDKTLYAVSTDESRYNLTGVYCESLLDGSGLRMVATDGHRLSVVERAMDASPKLKMGVIIPRKGLFEMRRLIEGGVSEGRLGFVKNSAVFDKDGVTLTMQLVDGRFPDYKQVLPPAANRRVRIDKALLAGALKRTSLLSKDKSQGVRLELKKDQLSLFATTPDTGEAREDLDVEFDGEPLTIGFNFRFLNDVLSVITEDSIELELTDTLSPGVLRGAGTEGYQAVVMPMRL